MENRAKKSEGGELATFPAPFRGTFGSRLRSYGLIFSNHNRLRVLEVVTRSMINSMFISGSVWLHIENRGHQQ